MSGLGTAATSTGFATLLTDLHKFVGTFGGRSQSSACPLLALSGHAELHCTCPLLGVKRTWRLHCEMSANDPKRTSSLRREKRTTTKPIYKVPLAYWEGLCFGFSPILSSARCISPRRG